MLTLFVRGWQGLIAYGCHSLVVVIDSNTAQTLQVLEKHKEKQREAYLEEEKAQELRQFSEIGVQRFFIQTRENEEEQAELQKIIEETNIDLMEEQL